MIRFWLHHLLSILGDADLQGLGHHQNPAEYASHVIERELGELAQERVGECEAGGVSGRRRPTEGPY